LESDVLAVYDLAPAACSFDSGFKLLGFLIHSPTFPFTEEAKFGMDDLIFFLLLLQ
jgi:hypothetical protein